MKTLFTAPFDAATELKDSGAALTANIAGTVASVARVLNLGTGFCPMTWVVDVDALDISSGDEGYTIELQGSTDVSFATGTVILAAVKVGKATAINEANDRGVGRLVKEVINAVDGVTPLPYVRAFLRVAGTTPSIQYRSHLTKSVLR